MHIFGDKYYESETGNWYGTCARCGKKLAVYTGANDDEPTEVGSYAAFRTMAGGDNVIFCDFELFRAGKPNAIVYIGPCNESVYLSTGKPPLMGALHYLSPEEECALKENVPYDSIDRKARELVALANSVSGIATMQSCAGHVELADVESLSFIVQESTLCFRASQERTQQILFEVAPAVGIKDCRLRIFDDLTFWIEIVCDPSERGVLFALFDRMKKTHDYR